MRRFFQMSLAGAQIIMRDMMRARWSNETGLVNMFDKLDEEDKKGLCGMYVIHTTGYRNLKVLGMALTAAALIIVQLVAFEVEGEYKPVRALWKFFKWVYSLIMEGLKLLIRGAVDLAHMVKCW